MKTLIVAVLKHHISNGHVCTDGKSTLATDSDIDSLPDKSLLKTFLETMKEFNSYQYDDFVYKNGLTIENDDVKELIEEIFDELLYKFDAIYDRDIEDELYLSEDYFDTLNDSDMLVLLMHNLFDHQMFSKIKKQVYKSIL